MVGEFPELQGIIGGHLARAQGEHPAVADAIRDHYKPVGQGDDVPTDPVTVAVSLADKLDTITLFFTSDLRPTGSKDPFALRRAALGILSLLFEHNIRMPLNRAFEEVLKLALTQVSTLVKSMQSERQARAEASEKVIEIASPAGQRGIDRLGERARAIADIGLVQQRAAAFAGVFDRPERFKLDLLDFFADRLKVQQREAGVRHDLIDAVFALGGEDDLVRLLARVRALQAFVETGEGADLLAGYKRAANILKKEGHSELRRPGLDPGQGCTSSADNEGSPAPDQVRGDDEIVLSYTPESAEADLMTALDSAEPAAATAIAGEDFAAAMTALAALRTPIDAFFETVTVNDADPAKRAARLALLARFRDAVHRVADFSKIEG